LLVWRNAFLVLDLGLDAFCYFRWFNIKSDALSSLMLSVISDGSTSRVMPFPVSVLMQICIVILGCFWYMMSLN
jgi:hypothetical protein